MSGIIPTVHFNTDDLPASGRFEAWRSAVHAHRTWLPEGADPIQFRAVADAWTFGDIVLVRSRLPPVCLARTPEMALADGENWISVAFQVSGTTTFTLDRGDSVLTVGPGEIIVFDMTRDFKAETPAHEVITCAISRRAMLQALADIPPHHGLLIEGSWGRLLADYMLALVRELPAMPAAHAADLSRTFIHLLAACMKAANGQAAAPIPRRTADIRQAIVNHIENNLKSAELDPQTICKALGISKAHLYRAFANNGGVTAYIRKRRLETIHVRLCDPSEPRNIGEIAFEYGFVSNAHFSRLFRQTFGFSPRDVRIGQPVSFDVDRDQDDLALFRSWIRRLS